MRLLWGRDPFHIASLDFKALMLGIGASSEGFGDSRDVTTSY